MVKIFAIATAAIALVGQVAAQDPPVGPTCSPGQIYCGFRLLDGVSGPFWRPRIEAIRPPVPSPDDSTFRCVTPTTVELVQLCTALPGNQRCQPNSSNKCTGPFDDCCAPA
ncbi:uncharacterized protein PpBr36_10677 [Pyricularia pennisetigena]|uniref:uncharacterized protein n=1 Tax=Pyricularia pennisetigena TaxID=1578925 RepID=UPI001154DAE6|nr:uncharacterized protein PpBr36_10677 [Pyricularia pennisetigena]TLS20943.1 hypothetical protein PpBr36_10677 [Pyricularia pennisetigena]